MPSTPLYRTIMEDIRRRIAIGDLRPDDPLPTTDALAEQYGCGKTTVRAAIDRLIDAGDLRGQQGKGVRVASTPPRRLVREAHGRNLRAGSGSTSPFARDAAAAGRSGGWEHASAHAVADELVAERLGLEVGAPVMRTDYRFIADGAPIQLSTSWEPLAITGGTDVEWPEDGAAVGVVARMDRIGQRVDEFVERVTARIASADEAERLGLGVGAPVLAIARTYYAAAVAVETADIVIGGDRYELLYRVPVD